MVTTGNEMLKPDKRTWKRRTAGILLLVLGCSALFVAIISFIDLSTATDAQVELGDYFMGFLGAILGILFTSGGILALRRKGFALAVTGSIIITLVGLIMCYFILSSIESQDIPIFIIFFLLLAIGVLATVFLFQSKQEFRFSKGKIRGTLPNRPS